MKLTHVFNRRALIAALAAAGLVAASTPLLTSFAADAPSAAAADPAPTVLRRLTQLQYKNIIADVFGPDIKIGGRFDPDMRQDGLLEVGTGRASIAASGLAQYVSMARSVAGQVLDENHRAVFVACKPADKKAADEACAKNFLSEAGRMLYRRPLEPAELAALAGGAGQSANTLHDFYAGLETSLSTMLQSPEFLFRWEVRERDPVDQAKWRVDAYSKAARLSFFLWNSGPDARLLAAAQKGDINTPRGLAHEVDRMLASPRLERGVRAFFYDMLGLDALQNMAKDTTLYPKYSFKIANDAEEQTLRTIIDVVLTQRGDYRDIFTTRKTFLTRQLGAIYGVPIAGPSAGGTPDGWQPYEFAANDPRGGIIAQPSFLALHSHPGRTSPTLRGKALRESILCQKVPDPPGNVNFNVVQDTKNPMYKTVRQRLTAHATEAMCTGCHKITDPIGLAMEHFDTIGSLRNDENGAAIDTAGTIDGIAFSDIIGLSKAVHDHPATPACLVGRVYAYAVGRNATASENTWLKQQAEKSFAASGYKLVPLLRQVALTDSFFLVSPPDTGPAPVKSAANETRIPTGR